MTTKIRIPKVTKATWLTIQRGQIVETKKAMKVRFQKQTIEGVTIPQGFEQWLPGECIETIRSQFSSSPSVLVEAWKVNEILRTLYIDTLK